MTFFTSLERRYLLCSVTRVESEICNSDDILESDNSAVYWRQQNCQTFGVGGDFVLRPVIEDRGKVVLRTT